MAAEFDANFSISLSYDVQTDTFTVGEITTGSFKATVSVEVTADATFEVNEKITVNASLEYEYVGHIEGGWVGKIGGNYVLFSKTTQVEGSTFQVSVTPFPVCFLEGTRIATPTGERAVETLAVGDLVTTADGSARPVRWIGRQTIVALFADPLHAYPIRIGAGAPRAALPHPAHIL